MVYTYNLHNPTLKRLGQEDYKFGVILKHVSRDEKRERGKEERDRDREKRIFWKNKKTCKFCVLKKPDS